MPCHSLWRGRDDSLFGSSAFKRLQTSSDQILSDQISSTFAYVALVHPLVTAGFPDSSLLHLFWVRLAGHMYRAIVLQVSYASDIESGVRAGTSFCDTSINTC